MDDPGSFQAIHAGHGDIHKDYIGMELVYHADGVCAVTGLAAKLPFRKSLKYGLNTAPDKRVVVND